MPIARRVLETLAQSGLAFCSIISDGAAAVVREECGLEPGQLAGIGGVSYSDHDLASPLASGSRRTAGMAIVPCSANTVGKLAGGLGDTLITRAAQVHLKERRPLIVVPRETPLSAIMLRQLTSLAELGVVVLPASPAYYTHPKSVQDQTDFLAGRILDHLGVEHQLYQGWKAGAP
jgi:flavin prenyltransferase